MSSPAPTRSQRSETADLVTVIVFGALAVIVVAFTMTTRFLSTFRDGGFAWSVAIDQRPELQWACWGSRSDAASVCSAKRRA